jgi:heme-degrading monooxygenase HmoA
LLKFVTSPRYILHALLAAILRFTESRDEPEKPRSRNPSFQGVILVRRKNKKLGENSLITRIFKVRIDSNLRQEFEQKFQEISIPYVQSQKGLISFVVGNPTQWTPDNYLLITNWSSEEDLMTFAGKNWNKAVIPEGMEKFVVQCWVDHFILSDDHQI